jgi:hypothetical protein
MIVNFAVTQPGFLPNRIMLLFVFLAEVRDTLFHTDPHFNAKAQI